MYLDGKSGQVLGFIHLDEHAGIGLKLVQGKAAEVSLGNEGAKPPFL